MDTKKQAEIRSLSIKTTITQLSRQWLASRLVGPFAFESGSCLAVLLEEIRSLDVVEVLFLELTFQVLLERFGKLTHLLPTGTQVEDE
jgi:hypothetical protein